MIDASETTATFGIEPTHWTDCIQTTLGAYTSARSLSAISTTIGL